MAHVIQLAIGEFMSSLGVKERTKSWKAHERDQQFGDIESTDIGKSQRLRNEGNARITRVLAMKPGLAKIIEKGSIWNISESTKTDLCIAANACGIDYTETWSSKLVHWLSKSYSSNYHTTYYECENTVEFNRRVAWASPPITRIHPGVAQRPKIQWKPATRYNIRWMHHVQARDICLKAIPILDSVDITMAYSYFATSNRGIQWQVRSHGLRFMSFGDHDDTMDRRHIYLREVCVTEAVHIFIRSHTNDWAICHFSTHPQSFKEAVINWEVGQGNRSQSWWRGFVYDVISVAVSGICGKRNLCETLVTVSQ